jgi:hypothetical protein
MDLAVVLIGSRLGEGETVGAFGLELGLAGEGLRAVAVDVVDDARPKPRDRVPGGDREIRRDK